MKPSTLRPPAVEPPQFEPTPFAPTTFKTTTFETATSEPTILAPISNTTPLTNADANQADETPMADDNLGDDEDVLWGGLPRPTVTCPTMPSQCAEIEQTGYLGLPFKIPGCVFSLPTFDVGSTVGCFFNAPTEGSVVAQCLNAANAAECSGKAEKKMPLAPPSGRRKSTAHSRLHLAV
ncbi:hypothetical protein V2A60_009096 [Cordyceps javanica]